MDHNALLPSTESTESLRINAGYNFVLCEHTVENAERIATALQGSDIIVFEAIGFLADDNTRREYDSALTDYVSAGLTDDYKQALDKYFCGSEAQSSPDDRFYLKVLDSFTGTGIVVLTMDMNNDNPDFDSVVAMSNARYDYIDAIHDDNPLPDLEQKALIWASAAAFANSKREQIMASQLREIGRKHPGKSIGIVLGMTHTPVQHDLANDCTTTRQFVGSSTSLLPEGTKALYTYPNQITRMIRFGLVDKIGADLLRRTVVQAAFPRLNEKTSLKRADMDGMTSSEVQDLYKKLSV